MTLPDPSLDHPFGPGDQLQDRLPPTERDEDPQRAEFTRELTTGEARPLTADERHAAEYDQPRAERVYAPASERVPKEPVPGHRDFIEHTDPATPERQSVATVYAEPDLRQRPVRVSSRAAG